MNKYKNLKTLCAIFLSLVCTSVAANTETKPNYYKNVFLGISLDQNYFSSQLNEHVDPNIYIFINGNYRLSGFSAIIGKRWSHVGLQFGYSYLPSTIADSYYVNATLKHSNKFADALFFYPINKWCDLKSLIGAGFMHSEISGDYSYFTSYGKSTNPYNISRDQFSPRFGIGAEYKIGPNTNMDLMIKYQKVNFLYRNNIILSMGMFYHL